MRTPFWRLLAPLTLLLVAACAPLQDRSDVRAPLPAAPANSIFVSQGETVYTIAQRYGVTVRDLIEANRLVPPYLLDPGQRLSLPVPLTYMVRSGDTLYGISRQYSLDLAELVRLNGIEPPYTIRIGQSLRLPGVRSGAAPRTQVAQGQMAQRPVAPPSGRASTAADAPRPSRSPTVESQELAPLSGGQDAGTWQVRPNGSSQAGSGTTAEAPPTLRPQPAQQTQRRSVAPAFGMASDATANARPDATAAGPRPPDRQPAGTRAPSGVAVESLPPMSGQPETAAPAQPASAQPAPAQPAQAQPAQQQARPTEPQAVAPARQVAAVPAVPTAPPREAEPPPRGGRFLWPLTGTILSEFGPKEGGLHNDGINIAAPRGTPVVAADNGVVAYSGNELRGFGNLLLVRHADGWVTAYAHLDTTTVAQGQTVRRGQKIGTVGQTGNVRAPQLHFEIRRGSRAIDPREHLDGGRQTSERR